MPRCGTLHFRQSSHGHRNEPFCLCCLLQRPCYPHAPPSRFLHQQVFSCYLLSKLNFNIIYHFHFSNHSHCLNLRLFNFAEPQERPFLSLFSASSSSWALLGMYVCVYVIAYLPVFPILLQGNFILNKNVRTLFIGDVQHNCYAELCFHRH